MDADPWNITVSCCRNGRSYLIDGSPVNFTISAQLVVHDAVAAIWFNMQIKPFYPGHARPILKMAHSYPQARKKVDRKEKYYDCVKNMKDILDYDLVLHVLLL